ncbi:MAG: sensor domain-containing diguanylate cyclase [Butyrivibrio sp.]|nr:sensor domain-containing diguanylate cyclase [Butyrivibrio sp.]
MEQKYNQHATMYYNVRVVIDENMEIRQADASYYQLVGEDAAGLIFTRVIHPDDVNIIQAAVKVVMGTDKKYVAAARIRLKGGSYNWYFIGMSGYKSDIAMYISDVDLLGNADSNYNPLANRYFEFMDMIDGYIMQYDMETGNLVITIPGIANQIKIYDGTMEEWKEYMLSEGVLAKGEVNKFMELYNDILNGKQTINRQIRHEKLFGMHSIDSCFYNCKAFTEKGGKRYVLGIIYVINDKSDMQKILQSKSLDTGYKDVGADVLNKRAITDYTMQLIDNRPNRRISIAIIDIDDFKNINDTYGHLFGDRVIRDVASVIKHAVGKNGLCGRIGGDEMFVVLEDLPDKEELRGIFRMIKTGLAELYDNDPVHNKIKITCSIGSATYPEDAMEYKSLFYVADKTLYLAKEKGKNRYIIYRDELHHDYVYAEIESQTGKKGMTTRAGRNRALNNMILEYTVASHDRKKELLTQLCNVFSIDEIYIYDGIKHCFYQMFGNNPNINEEYYFVDKENYIKNFTKDGIFVIDNIDYFEGKSPTMFNLFNRVHLEQAVQYAMVKGEEIDLNLVVSFSRFNKKKKWSELEITSLGMMGCLIGNDFKNNGKPL